VFLIGEILQWLLPGEAPADAGTGRLKMLGATLLLGVLACLANPHTWHVFAVPPDLYAPQLAESFQNDDSFRSHFASPFDHLYYTHPSFGKSYSGYFYYGLLAFGVAAFGLNITQLRWSLLLP